MSSSDLATIDGVEDLGVADMAMPGPPADLALAPLDLAGATTATVVVDPKTPGLGFDSNFAGFSYEKGTMPIKLFDAGNLALIGLFKRLGPGLLRIGANDVDRMSWDPKGPGLTAKVTAPSDVDRLAAFLRATNWKVIYAVNLAANTTANAASEAQYAAQALGDRLYGFEIGNECDLYKGKYRDNNYSYTTFRGEWESYAAAIRGSVPGAVLTGPASAGNITGYTVPFAADEASKIALLTQHYYLANGMDPTSTIDKLLMPDPGLPGKLSQLDKAAKAAKLAGGFRLAEANSYYNGGASGVSNSFGSALWAIDFLFALVAGDAAGVNFHGGGNGTGYTPIANEADGTIVGPRPEYYGMLMFDLAAGKLLTATVSGSSAALSVHAVAAADGATVVVLINKDAARPIIVNVDFGAPRSSAALTRLMGPSLASTSGLTLGGVAIGADGAWTPHQATVPVVGSVASVGVPPASAVEVRAQ